MKLADTPQECADAVEFVMQQFGYDVSGDCAMHVAHAVIEALTRGMPDGSRRFVGTMLPPLVITEEDI